MRPCRSMDTGMTRCWAASRKPQLKSLCCPLDPAYPQARLQQMIATSACRLILSEQHLLEELAFLSDHATLPLDGHWHDALLGRFPETATQVAVLPDHLAYVIFTSGSTGIPKGVSITHANIVSLVATEDSIAVDSNAGAGQAASQASY